MDLKMCCASPWSSHVGTAFVARPKSNETIEHPASTNRRASRALWPMRWSP